MPERRIRQLTCENRHLREQVKDLTKHLEDSHAEMNELRDMLQEAIKEWHLLADLKLDSQSGMTEDAEVERTITDASDGQE